MSKVTINNRPLDEADAPLQEMLKAAYEAHIRPMCTPCGVEMYIALVNGRYILKRMPNTGSKHRPNCDSYEPPPELSGLGQVMDAAIRENLEDGSTELKFGFSLSKSPGRGVTPGAGGETDSVKTDGTKLTLRGTLHYLWEQSGFNRWAPGMTGKRNWFVIRKYLLKAAGDKVAKGQPLSDQLYIPESYSIEKKDELNARRLAQWKEISAPIKGARKLKLLVAEIKDIAPSRYGYKFIVKHLPDAHFMLSEDLHKRLMKRFEAELQLWNAYDDAHLIVVATFGVGPTGIASIEEVAVMVVNDAWIPFESEYEYQLLRLLIEGQRRFFKGLRYNLASYQPLASAVLTDTDPTTALYIIPPGASDEYTGVLEELIEDSSLGHWEWGVGMSAMPPLPSSHEDERQDVPSTAPLGIAGTCEHGVSLSDYCELCQKK